MDSVPPSVDVDNKLSTYRRSGFVNPLYPPSVYLTVSSLTATGSFYGHSGRRPEPGTTHICTHTAMTAGCFVRLHHRRPPVTLDTRGCVQSMRLRFTSARVMTNTSPRAPPRTTTVIVMNMIDWYLPPSLPSVTCKYPSKKSARSCASLSTSCLCSNVHNIPVYLRSLAMRTHMLMRCNIWHHRQANYLLLEQIRVLSSSGFTNLLFTDTEMLCWLAYVILLLPSAWRCAWSIC